MNAERDELMQAVQSTVRDLPGRAPRWRVSYDDATKGRTLVTTQDLSAGTLVFTESPLVVGIASNSGSAELRGSVPAVALDLLRRRAEGSVPYSLLQYRVDTPRHETPELEGLAARQLDRSYDATLEMRLQRRLHRFADRDGWARRVLDAIENDASLAVDLKMPIFLPAVRWALGVASVNSHGAEDGPARGLLGLLGSMPEHSCTPNARIDIGPIEDGSLISMTTLQEVAQGEPLSISYVSSAWPLEMRRAVLRLQYGFVCACERCAREEASQHEQATRPCEPVAAQQLQQQSAEEPEFEPFLPQLLALSRGMQGTAKGVHMERPMDL